MSVLWGWFFEGIAPDKYDIIGTIIAVIGVIIIYYIPRKGEEKKRQYGNRRNKSICSGILFFVAALMEIGGGYLVWLWIRERKQLHWHYLVGLFFLYMA